jgi:hypothetical protein
VLYQLEPQYRKNRAMLDIDVLGGGYHRLHFWHSVAMNASHLAFPSSNSP